MLAARKLTRRSERDQARRFTIEGRIAVRDALETRATVVEVFFDPEVDEAAEVAGDASGRGIETLPVGTRVLATIADTATPQGIVAVLEMPTQDRAILVKGDLVLILDEVRDPGNAGTLVRTALGAGASCVVFGSGSVDPYNPKTLRSSAGAILRVPVLREVPVMEAIEELRSAGFAVVGTDATAGDALENVDMTGPVALVVGNEARGVSEQVISAADATARIPMPGPLESLNAGIAGSIFLFEAVRQRRTTGVYPDQPSD